MEPGTRKHSIYVTQAMRDEIRAEARRLHRSMSWVVQRAWKIARQGVRALPAPDE